MSIADKQREYYRRLFRQHGHDPQSLGHRDRATQYERFHRIAKCFEGVAGGFGVHEIGCGLGHFGEFLEQHHPRADYSGSDIIEEFVKRCEDRFPDSSFFLRDISREKPGDRYDFVTLCGTFNNRLGRTDEECQEFAFSMLRTMYHMSSKGIAADFLSRYHDLEHARDDLYYQDEKPLMDFIVAELSRYFEVDLGGPLYECTVRIYRPEYLRSRYADGAFDRYFRRS
jgi:hypothetical protein